MAKPVRTKNKDNARRAKKKVSLLLTERVEYVDWKDVNLLRRFMSDRAKIRARRVTGNSTQQQARDRPGHQERPRDGAAALRQPRHPDPWPEARRRARWSPRARPRPPGARHRADQPRRRRRSMTLGRRARHRGARHGRARRGDGRRRRRTSREARAARRRRPGRQEGRHRRRRRRLRPQLPRAQGPGLPGQRGRRGPGRPRCAAAATSATPAIAPPPRRWPPASCRRSSRSPPGPAPRASSSARSPPPRSSRRSPPRPGVELDRRQLHLDEPIKTARHPPGAGEAPRRGRVPDHGRGRRLLAAGPRAGTSRRLVPTRPGHGIVHRSVHSDERQHPQGFPRVVPLVAHRPLGGR